MNAVKLPADSASFHGEESKTFLITNKYYYRAQCNFEFSFKTDRNFHGNCRGRGGLPFRSRLRTRRSSPSPHPLTSLWPGALEASAKDSHLAQGHAPPQTASFHKVAHMKGTKPCNPAGQSSPEDQLRPPCNSTAAQFSLCAPFPLSLPGAFPRAFLGIPAHACQSLLPGTGPKTASAVHSPQSSLSSAPQSVQ